MTKEELAEVVRLHDMWLRGESGGARANLRGADLCGADLRGANLRGANLRLANLCEADLCGANLRLANLCEADLCGANLCRANLCLADLCRANLCLADLCGANLCGADLRGANLRLANLCDANLCEAKDGAVARLDFGGWSVCVRAEHTSIGCRRHDNAKWLEWTPESPEIAAMHADAADWWRVHGEAVQAVIRCVMEKAGDNST